MKIHLFAAILLGSTARGLAAFCTVDARNVCDAKYMRHLGADATCGDAESVVRAQAQCYINVGCKSSLEYSSNSCTEYSDVCDGNCDKVWSAPDALEPRRDEDLSDWDTCNAGLLAIVCKPKAANPSCDDFAAESESMLRCAASLGCSLDAVRDTFYDYHCNALAAFVQNGPCTSTCASIADAWAENAPPITVPTFPFPDELCDPSNGAACGVAQVFNNVNCSGDAAWTTPVPINTAFNEKPPRHYIGVHPAEATVPGKAQGLVSSGAICDQDKSDCTERILLPLHKPRTCVAVGERSVRVDFDYRRVGVCDVGEDNCGLIEFGTQCTADGIDSQMTVFFRVPDGECHAFGPHGPSSLACDGDKYMVRTGCDASCESCRIELTLMPGQCEEVGWAVARNACGSKLDGPSAAPTSSPSVDDPYASTLTAAPTKSLASEWSAKILLAMLACIAAHCK